MNFNFVKNRRIFYGLSIGLTVLTVIFVASFGVRWGIDFTGGSVLSLGYQNQVPSNQQIIEALFELGLKEVSVQVQGEKTVILKMPSITEETHQQMVARLKSLAPVVDGSESFDSIGPIIGNELKGKIKTVVALSLLAILIYIAIAFRKISYPVKSYIYGITGIVALFHDVMIPVGVWAILGKYYGYEITIPIITGLLTVFGYSINDTVVVFDRIRENLMKEKGADFAAIINKSLNQTFARSVNTSLTVLIVLAFLFIFGGATLKPFALALLIGISLGTYSSVFLASPLIYSFYKIREKRA
ncbi:MAG: protein translocase subunit SecF [Candidatus Pacebacteria bacterium]|nr:protein translocase subunit SecF [Candidatus Paceibacterota bacterium]